MSATARDETGSDGPVLEVSGLHVRSMQGDGRSIVQDIGFTVRAGETVCVVGESGSGKSVTSLAVMGLLPQGVLQVAGGNIQLDGESIVDASPRRLRQLRATKMAMVFQEPMTALNPVLTVGDQVDEVLRTHTRLERKARQKRILDIFESVHLPDVRRVYASYPHQLSGGQRQRIVIAMALVLGPRLLIADEPTTALDVTTQKQILSLIKELQQKHGTAVLFITHDFGVVCEIADRIVVMNQGRMVESGSRLDILMRPADAYTRMLVSSVPSLIPRISTPISEDVVLQVKGLNKIYSVRSLMGGTTDYVANRDVDLTLRKGEILGVVGESGSGKSTLARCVVRLVQPTSGEILMKNVPMGRDGQGDLHAMRRHIQIVFQDPYRSLNPRQRIGESILEGMMNFGAERREALGKARDLLELVGLSADCMGRYPHQFSGGQRQRICIARALALEPSILVADEAVSALDVSVQAQVLSLFQDIRARLGVSILFITHDLRVAAQICDTIVVMQYGQVVEVGPAADVLTVPEEPYTQTLVDAAPGRNWDFQNFCPQSAHKSNADWAWGSIRG